MIEFQSEEEFRKWFENPSVLKKYGIERVLWSQSDFPDLKFRTTSERVVLAEVEVRTSNFDLHKHEEEQVDLVIVWVHDEPYRKRKFKVLDVSMNEASKVASVVDQILKSEEDLVYQRLSRLPAVAIRSLDKEDFQLIKRYKKAWKIINQRDIEQFFTADLDELVKEFKSYIEVDKDEFLNRARYSSEWFPNRVFHPFLCFMAKAIVIRGTLKLIKDGILQLQNPNNNTIANIYSSSKGQCVKFRKIIERRKLAFALGDFPFALYEERMGFYTDYLDAFIQNFNFRASNSLPTKEIALTLQEITVWEKFGIRDISEEEALNMYGLKKSRYLEDQFNPMRLEFSPVKIVSFSWKLASKLREYGFVAPDCSKQIIQRIYDLVVQPIGVITHADKMPKINDIEFFFYPQNRIEDVLRRFETTKGFTRQDGISSLKRFYQEYPSRFRMRRIDSRS